MRPFQVKAPIGPLLRFDGPDGLKAHCRCDTDEEQSLIEAYEAAAVAYLDGYTGRLGRCILRQKWALPLIGSAKTVHLPFPDCRDFAVETLRSDGAWSEVDGVSIQTGYDSVALVGLPQDRTGLHLTTYAGWEDAAAVPGNLKQAVRLLVAHWFENRAAVTTGQAPHQVPMAVEAMIAPLVHVFA